MSETVNYNGRIREFTIPSELVTTQEIVTFLSLKFNIPEGKFDTHKDEIYYIDSERIFCDFNTGKWYEVLEKDFNDGDDDYFIAKKNNDVIEFSVRYYNGGCSFNEALSTAIKNIKEKEE